MLSDKDHRLVGNHAVSPVAPVHARTNRNRSTAVCAAGTTTSSASISSHPRIHYAVDQLPVFEDAATKHAFTNEPAFLQHTHRGGIPFEDCRFEALQIEVLKD